LEIQAQDRIVHFVDEAFGWLTSVQKDSLHALSGLTSLNEAILAKAFRGELVAPDPTDLSGTELLARIATWKAMRAEQPSRDESRPAPESKSPPNKTKEVPMGKRRTDVGEKYLTDILSRMGGVSDASALWQRSEMDIDEFYKQLRAEVQAGLIREQAEKGRLVRTNAT
jgi:type I restriction enzyme S subunit